MSERIRKVNQLVKTEIGRYLEMNLSPDLGLVTITAVETSPDMRSSTVWYSYVGAKASNLKREINSARRDMNYYLVTKMSSKIVPRLVFKQDFSGDYAQNISKLIDESLNGNK